ncbi:MAG: hypothetical protein KGL34_09430 [Gammaproteobacteria bacterium]|nr:hypothetical protein [Gammaproteobacteria bacterium]
MNAIGIVAALGAEARTLRGARRVRDPSARLAPGEHVLVSGIGPRAASLAARSLADAGADALVSWGTAGGLDPALRPGTLLLPCEILADGGDRYCVDPAWRAREIERLAPQPAVLRFGAVADGALLSSAAAIADREAKQLAHRQSGAVAVDMESAAVAAVAADRRLPLLVVRAIVDGAGDEIPPAIVEASRAGPIRASRLIGGLLRSPAELGAMLRLAGRFAAARATLRVVAAAGLAAPSP